MTQEIGEPIRTKYTSCPSCGVFKVKDGWNYGEQICVCGFGKRPTEDEIENEQYLTAQVHNMLIDLIRLEQENAGLLDICQVTRIMLRSVLRERDFGWCMGEVAEIVKRLDAVVLGQRTALNGEAGDD